MTSEEAKQILDRDKPLGSVDDKDFKTAKKWALKDKNAACLSRPWGNSEGMVVASDGKRIIELGRDFDNGEKLVPCSMYCQGSTRYHVSGTATGGGFIVCDKKEEFTKLDDMEYMNYRKFFNGLNDNVQFYIAFDAIKTKALCDAVNAMGGDFRCVKLTYTENGVVNAFAGNPNGVYVQAYNMAEIVGSDGTPFIGNAVTMLPKDKHFIGIDPTFLADWVTDFPELPLGYIGAEKPLYYESYKHRAMILPMRTS